MKITLNNAGKRFNREWIFRHITSAFISGNSYAVTGPNGSGKSTFLQTLSGNLNVNEGSLHYVSDGNKEVDADDIYRHISICAPYVELVEEMTLQEFLTFHFAFKPCLPGITIQDISSLIELDSAVEKQMRFYSSGMKQRVRLAQAVFADVPVLLLDEPCTNFDERGYILYQNLVVKYCRNKLLFVSSNDEREYAFCKERLNLTDYK